jgi:hypothetical protein
MTFFLFNTKFVFSDQKDLKISNLKFKNKRSGAERERRVVLQKPLRQAPSLAVLAKYTLLFHFEVHLEYTKYITVYPI